MGLLQKKQQERRRPQTAGDERRAFSYHGSRSTLNQNTGRSLNRPTGASDHSKRHHLINWSVSIIIAGSLAYCLWLGGTPRVSIRQEPGTAYRSVETYQDGVADVWDDSFFNRFKLTLSSKRAERKILETYPELASAEIRVPLLGSRPYIVLTPDHAVVSLLTTSGVYLINADGKALIKLEDASYEEPDKTIVPVTDETNFEVRVGQQALSASQVAYLRVLHAGLKEVGAVVKTVTLPPEHNQVHVFLAGTSYYLKFSFSEDVLQGIGAYKAFMGNSTHLAVQPQEYIDLRVPEKIYYK